jgi:hypothetical protein
MVRVGRRIGCVMNLLGSQILASSSPKGIANKPGEGLSSPHFYYFKFQNGLISIQF